MLTIKKHVNPSDEQWDIIIEGVRNPLNSWDQSDSGYGADGEYHIGERDYKLMLKLSRAGSDHAKFRRMIPILVTITAPLYWWKEFDTYKVGTTANSCSTMHTIHKKPFTTDDFSDELLHFGSADTLNSIIDDLNFNRQMFLDTGDRSFWDSIIQILPTSYNQTRTVALNYEVLRNIYFARRNHKLAEWHVLCDWITTLPYSEFITVEGAKA
jgi:hypothetical protein